jgi:serine/threonine protein kinase
MDDLEPALVSLEACSHAAAGRRDALDALVTFRGHLDTGEVRDLEFDSPRFVAALRRVLLSWLGTVAGGGSAPGSVSEGGGADAEDVEGVGDVEEVSWVADEYRHIVGVLLDLPEMTASSGRALLDHTAAAKAIAKAFIRLGTGTAGRGGGGVSDAPLASLGSGSSHPQPAGAASVAAMLGQGSNGSSSLVDNHDWPLVQRLMHLAYAWAPLQRRLLRRKLGSVLSAAAAMGETARSITDMVTVTLDIIATIIPGMASPLSTEDVALLEELILPLHGMPGKISHLQPALALFHEPLVRCVVLFIRKDPPLVHRILQSILTEHWPTAWAGNTPKEVLLMHEVEMIIETAAGAVLDGARGGAFRRGPLARPGGRRDLLSRLALCISSQHSTVAERSLQLWKNRKVVSALLLLEGDDNDGEGAGEGTSSGEGSGSGEGGDGKRMDHARMDNARMDPVLVDTLRGEVYGRLLTPLIRHGAVHWNETVRRMAGLLLRVLRDNDRGCLAAAAKDIDVAFIAEAEAARVRPVTGRGGDGDDAAGKEQEGKEAKEQGHVAEEEKGSSSNAASIERRLDALMDSLAPPPPTPQTPHSTDSASSSSASSSAVRVPQQADLCLFDMVFGHDLGRGAYGSVRYAKRIQRGQPRSVWPEYAVKEVPKEHAELARREVLVMEELGLHPHVTGLICYFESKTAVHLVLEYASGGDLHDRLADLGPLAEANVKFIAGEILMGLRHIHAKGFVYGDLKPENVLIDGHCHVKLSDLGAARRLDECVSGGVLEGTAQYMAPEVAAGGAPTFSADVFAFGVLVFQALAGRPPPWSIEEEVGGRMGGAGRGGAGTGGGGNGSDGGSDDGGGDDGGDVAAVLQQMVHFDETAMEQSSWIPDHFTSEAGDLVACVLVRDAHARPTLDDLGRHGFLSSLDLLTLHEQTPPALGTNTAAPRLKTPWTRRTYSLMHSPMPSAYDVDLAGVSSPLDTAIVIAETDEERAASWTRSSAAGCDARGQQRVLAPLAEDTSCEGGGGEGGGGYGRFGGISGFGGFGGKNGEEDDDDEDEDGDEVGDCFGEDEGEGEGGGEGEGEGGGEGGYEGKTVFAALPPLPRTSTATAPGGGAEGAGTNGTNGRRRVMMRAPVKECVKAGPRMPPASFRNGTAPWRAGGGGGGLGGGGVRGNESGGGAAKKPPASWKPVAAPWGASGGRGGVAGGMLRRGGGRGGGREGEREGKAAGGGKDQFRVAGLDLSAG